MPAIQKICAAVTEVPIIVFAKDAQYILNDFADLDCQVIGMDWKMDVAETRAILPNHSLQGNLDPAVLYGDNLFIREKTLDMLSRYGGKRHICNLGHGVYPDTPLDGVKCFVDTVKGHVHAWFYVKCGTFFSDNRVFLYPIYPWIQEAYALNMA